MRDNRHAQTALAEAINATEPSGQSLQPRHEKDRGSDSHHHLSFALQHRHRAHSRSCRFRAGVPGSGVPSTSGPRQPCLPLPT